MLPYRLKRPPNGTKRKRNEHGDQQIRGDRNGGGGEQAPSGGGPIQTAIEEDLVGLYDDFLQAIHPLPITELVHKSKGSSFGIFRGLFSNAKVALLHSRLVPPRCDRGQYAQLIYAACLSLLKKSFQDEPFRLERASYALFCLYVLFETNPLPPGPTQQSTLEDKLQLLPMGLQGENPKLAFRRSFRDSIRIDRYHYSLLLNLREESLTSQSFCEKQRLQATMNQLESRKKKSAFLFRSNQQYTSEPHSQEDRGSEIAWTCMCGVATDSIHILDRLFSNLECCEYSGPCSLEGLAGHADYPVPCVQPSAQQTNRFQKIRKDRLKLVPDMDMEILLVGAEPLPMPQHLLSDVRRYQSTLRAIQIPVTLSQKQMQRMQESLAPIRESSDICFEALISRAVAIASEPALTDKVHKTSRESISIRQLSNHRRVTFAGVSAINQSNAGGASSTNKKSNCRVLGQPMTYELVFSRATPANVQKGIQKSLGHVLDRDHPMFLPVGDSETDYAHRESSLQRDVESLPVNGMAAASSVNSGMGAAALHELLKTATSSEDHEPVSLKAMNYQDTFLSIDEIHNFESGANNHCNLGGSSDSSVLSMSDAEEDAESIALAALLPGANKGKKAKTAKSAGENKSKSSRQQQSNFKQKAGKQSWQRADEISLSSNRTGEGEAALNFLLQMVESNSDGDGNSEEVTIGDSTQSLGNSSSIGRAAIASLLVQARSSGNEPGDRQDGSRNRDTRSSRKKRTQTNRKGSNAKSYQQSNNRKTTKAKQRSELPVRSQTLGRATKKKAAGNFEQHGAIPMSLDDHSVVSGESRQGSNAINLLLAEAGVIGKWQPKGQKQKK